MRFDTVQVTVPVLPDAGADVGAGEALTYARQLGSVSVTIDALLLIFLSDAT